MKKNLIEGEEGRGGVPSLDLRERKRRGSPNSRFRGGFIKILIGRDGGGG